MATKIPDSFSAAFGKIGDQYLKALYRFAKAYGIPVVHFKKGQNKEEVARPYLEAAAKEAKERVVVIDSAREGLGVEIRAEERSGENPHPHMDWGREMAFVNHFYFYLWDSEWGAAPGERKSVWELVEAVRRSNPQFKDQMIANLWATRQAKIVREIGMER